LRPVRAGPARGDPGQAACRCCDRAARPGQGDGATDCTARGAAGNIPGIERKDFSGTLDRRQQIQYALLQRGIQFQENWLAWGRSLLPLLTATGSGVRD
jgi:hypothetical protein